MLRVVVRRLQKLQQVTDLVSTLITEPKAKNKVKIIENFVLTNDSEKRYVLETLDLLTRKNRPFTQSQLNVQLSPKVVEDVFESAKVKNSSPIKVWDSLITLMSKHRGKKVLDNSRSGDIDEISRDIGKLASLELRPEDSNFIKSVLTNSLITRTRISEFEEAFKACLGKGNWSLSDLSSLEKTFCKKLEQSRTQLFSAINFNSYVFAHGIDDVIPKLSKFDASSVLIEPNFSNSNFQVHFDVLSSEISFFTLQSYNITPKLSFLKEKFLTDAKTLELNKGLLVGSILVRSQKDNNEHFSTLKLNCTDESKERLLDNVCFLAFDILAKNNKFLTEKTLAQRQKILKTLLSDEAKETNFIRLLPSTPAKVSEDFTQILSQEVENAKRIGANTIVLRQTDIPHLETGRQGKVKLLFPTTKPVKTWHLLAVGGLVRRNSPEGFFASISLAAKDNDGNYTVVAKHTLSPIYQVSLIDLARLKPLITEEKPDNVKGDHIDVYFKQKLVFEVESSGVGLSKTYFANRKKYKRNMGLILKNLKVIKERPDMKTEEVTTVDQIDKEFR